MQSGKEPPALGHGVSNSQPVVPPLTSNLLCWTGNLHLILAAVWTYRKPHLYPYLREEVFSAMMQYRIGLS